VGDRQIMQNNPVVNAVHDFDNRVSKIRLGWVSNSLNAKNEIISVSTFIFLFFYFYSRHFLIEHIRLNKSFPCVVRFQALTAMSLKMTVFWDIASCSLVEVYWRFRGSHCLIALIMEAVSTSETSVNFY
jgi:hypothetical protein